VAEKETKKINMTVSIDEQLVQEIRVFRDGGGTFPISETVETALRSALEGARQPHTMSVVERLRREKDQRLGPDFELGVREGVRWSRGVASWKELKHFAGIASLDIEAGHDEEYGAWIAFIGTNHPSEEDYTGPAFLDEDGNVVYEIHRCRRYWLGWLEGIRSVYWEVWDYMEPEAIIGRAEAVGLQVAVNKGMAVLIGSLDGVQDRDASLLSDFSAHRTEITSFMRDQHLGSDSLTQGGK
jgi:hypothetical protein